jgi:hypothetical protein
MASNASNAEALAAHREAFSLALDEYYKKLHEYMVTLKQSMNMRNWLAF